MTIKQFLKDKLYLIIVTLVIMVSISSFLYFINISKSVILMVNIAIFVVFFSVMFVEFHRRYEYYNEIIKMVNTMDEKYLVFDLIENKYFLDAYVMQEIVRLGNYSMNQKVNLYRTSQEEYQNYIELWVHEIKTPLAALKLMDANKNLTNASEELERISYYIDQALYYARSNAVYKDYLIEEVDLKKSVLKTIKQLSNSFIKKDLNINMELSSNTVYSDSKWLEFIIKQILINSVQYSKEHGEITIRSKNLDNAILLEIIDNGIGIKPEDIPRVFDLGFTGSSGRVYNQATGMGLYLVKKLSESLYINVSISSDEQTIVSLRIPKSTTHFKY